MLNYYCQIFGMIAALITISTLQGTPNVGWWFICQGIILYPKKNRRPVTK
jgi:hypothetical protein